MSFRLDLEDKHTQVHLSSLLKRPSVRVGVYEHLADMQSLLDRWNECPSELLKRLTKPGLELHCVYDVDSSLDACIASYKVRTLVDQQKLSVHTNVQLRYMYGNVFAFLLLEDIDERCLRTDRTCFVIHGETKQLYSIKTGDFTQPNQLYLKPNLHDITTTLEKTMRIPQITSYSVISKEDLSLVDLPQ